MSRFEKSQDEDIYSLFSNYKEKTIQMSNEHHLNIKTHLHELFSPPNIFLLARNQHSKTLLKAFSEVILNSLHSRLTNKFDGHFKETDIDYEAQVLN